MLGWLLFSVSAGAQGLESGTPALAEPGRFGLGLGGSTLANGVTGKVYLSDRLAAQALVGWWLGAGFSFGADVIYERAIAQAEPLTFQLYAGAGPSIGLFSVGADATVFAASAVGGAGLQLVDVPLELTLELRPTVIVGNTFFNGFALGGGGALRYYF